MALVHLTVVPTASEAEIITALLRTEGIESEDRATNLGSGFMDGMPGGGPREILVDEESLARAQELVAGAQDG
jgi:putative signal transducing protein